MPNIHEYAAPSVGVSRVGGSVGTIGIQTGSVSAARPSEGGINALEGAARTLGYHASLGSSQMESVARGMQQAGAASGRATRDLAEGAINIAGAVGSIVAKHQEQQEVSKFYADYAGVADDVTRQWGEARANADPNDPGVIKRFNEQVAGPALDKFMAGYTTQTGQRMAEEASSHLRDHLFTRQFADQATAAGEASVQNVQKFQTYSADSLVKDPSFLDFWQSSTKAMVTDLKRNPLLSAEQAAHLDTLQETTLKQNAMAALHGMASVNPAGAKQALDAGMFKEYFNEQEIAQADSYIHGQTAIKREADNAARIETERQQREDVSQATNKLVSSTIDTATGMAHITPDFFKGVQDLALMPGIAKDDAKTIFDWGQAQLRKEITGALVRSDSAVVEDFNARMLLTPDDPRALKQTDVMAAGINGQLSKSDQTAYLRMAAEMAKDPAKRDAYAQFNKFLVGMKSTITKSSPLTGFFPEQDQRYGQFQFDMRQRFDLAYQNGTWKTLLDARNTEFLGKLAGPYMYDSKEGMKQVQKSITSGVSIAEPAPAQPGQPPNIRLPSVDLSFQRKPGETPEQFLKRKGGG